MMNRKLDGPPPGSRWIWHTDILLSAPAWRGMSKALRYILDFLEIENMNHAGLENGKLLASFDDLARYGVRRKSIAAAIKEGERRRLIVARRDGRDLATGKRRPTLYRLTYLPTLGDTAGDEWKKFRNPVAESPLNLGAKAPLGKKSNASKIAKSPGAKTPLKPRGENAPTLYISEVSTSAADHCAACDGCTEGVDCPAGNVIWGEFRRAAS
jgi:hypothetical protein